jgi:hypothetical protein
MAMIRRPVAKLPVIKRLMIKRLVNKGMRASANANWQNLPCQRSGAA